MVFYWYAIKAGAPGALAGAVVGGVGGVLTAALFALPGVEPGVSALAGPVVCWWRSMPCWRVFGRCFSTKCYMLLATVGTIPDLLVKPDVTGMLSAVVLSAVYFGAVSWLARTLIERRARRRTG